MIKRTVRGVGYNSGGRYIAKSNGQENDSYRVWKSMITRCYDSKYHARRPTYKDCEVATEWHDYQNFAEWFYSKKYSGSGYQLDKDILSKGNKIYSPETCCFVPRDLNVLLNSVGKIRGKYPQGVGWHKINKKYFAQISIGGKFKHLGYYNTVSDAYEVYKKAKEANVKRMADLWFGNIETRVYEALMDWSL